MNEYPDDFPDIRKRMHTEAIRKYDSWYIAAHPRYFRNIYDPTTIIIRRDMPIPFMPKELIENFKQLK